MSYQKPPHNIIFLLKLKVLFEFCFLNHVAISRVKKKLSTGGDFIKYFTSNSNIIIYYDAHPDAH